MGEVLWSKGVSIVLLLCICITDTFSLTCKLKYSPIVLIMKWRIKYMAPNKLLCLVQVNCTSYWKCMSVLLGFFLIMPVCSFGGSRCTKLHLQYSVVRVSTRVTRHCSLIYKLYICFPVKNVVMVWGEKISM